MHLHSLMQFTDCCFEAFSDFFHSHICFWWSPTWGPKDHSLSLQLNGLYPLYTESSNLFIMLESVKLHVKKHYFFSLTEWRILYFLCLLYQSFSFERFRWHQIVYQHVILSMLYVVFVLILIKHMVWITCKSFGFCVYFTHNSFLLLETWPVAVHQQKTHFSEVT